MLAEGTPLHEPDPSTSTRHVQARTHKAKASRGSGQSGDKERAATAQPKQDRTNPKRSPVVMRDAAVVPLPGLTSGGLKPGGLKPRSGRPMRDPELGSTSRHERRDSGVLPQAQNPMHPGCNLVGKIEHSAECCLHAHHHRGRTTTTEL